MRFTAMSVSAECGASRSCLKLWEMPDQRFDLLQYVRNFAKVRTPETLITVNLMQNRRGSSTEA